MRLGIHALDGFLGFPECPETLGAVPVNGIRCHCSTRCRTYCEACRYRLGEGFLGDGTDSEGLASTDDAGCGEGMIAQSSFPGAARLAVDAVVRESLEDRARDCRLDGPVDCHWADEQVRQDETDDHDTVEFDTFRHQLWPAC